ncbi:MAG TPA: hypothetical protein VJ066_02015 [Candidatus Bathyarchaeia archaeon]|nr:hypothetical protein [Candidatus Bathyarchaeia archaeon]
MDLRRALVDTLRSRRFWKWEIGGLVLYGIPATIRFITRNSYIPILSWPGLVHNYYVPGNLVEKVLVNAFFPGGAGGVAGEIFVRNYKGKAVQRRTKYLSRLGGALVQTAFWSAIQYLGYHQFVIGPFGGNIFEPPTILPFNFLLATLSIFTPDVLQFLKSRIKSAHRKIRGRAREKH